MIKIESNFNEIAVEFKSMNRQLPFAMSKAINDTAVDTKKVLRTQMKQVFNNPTPFTLNSIMHTWAKKNNLESVIKLKDFAGKGTPASQYLSAQITGGKRDQKRSEWLLKRRGVLGTNEYWVPGSGIKLNKYGNITSGQITKILSGIKAHTETGFLANETPSSRARNRNRALYFVITSNSKSHLAPGIYERKNGRIKPVMIFVKRTNYNIRYRFIEVATNNIKKVFDKKLEDAIEFAFKTAK